MKIDHVRVEELVASQGREVQSFAPVVENETQIVLRRALELLGPDGENWIQNRYHKRTGILWWKRDTYCAIGAIRHVERTTKEGPVEKAANWIVWKTYRTVVMGVNDRAKSFGEVRAMFETAISLAADPELRKVGT